MDIHIDEKSSVPIYRQIVDTVRSQIEDGTLPAGQRLLTVRQLAEQSGIAQGTVKHAYDTLESLGLVEMTQGRGTFVCDIFSDKTGRKEQAMQLIDDMLDGMGRLSFSLEDTRIFLELKMRERQGQIVNLKVCIVDCSSEAIAAIHEQLAAIPRVDLYSVLLDDAMQAPEKLDDDYGVVITTASHFDSLQDRLDESVPLVRIVMTETPETVASLARIQEKDHVGILTRSRRFSGVVQRGLGLYTTTSGQINIAFFGGGDVGDMIKNSDVLIVPSNYHSYSSAKEEQALSNFTQGGGTLILYGYNIDKGSLLYLRQLIDEKQSKLPGIRQNTDE